MNFRSFFTTPARLWLLAALTGTGACSSPPLAPGHALRAPAAAAEGAAFENGLPHELEWQEQLEFVPFTVASGREYVAAKVFPVFNIQRDPRIIALTRAQAAESSEDGKRVVLNRLPPPPPSADEAAAVERLRLQGNRFVLDVINGSVKKARERLRGRPDADELLPDAETLAKLAHDYFQPATHPYGKVVIFPKGRMDRAVASWEIEYARPRRDGGKVVYELGLESESGLRFEPDQPFYKNKYFFVGDAAGPDGTFGSVKLQQFVADGIGLGKTGVIDGDTDHLSTYLYLLSAVIGRDLVHLPRWQRFDLQAYRKLTETDQDSPAYPEYMANDEPLRKITRELWEKEQADTVSAWEARGGWVPLYPRRVQVHTYKLISAFYRTLGIDLPEKLVADGDERGFTRDPARERPGSVALCAEIGVFAREWSKLADRRLNIPVYDPLARYTPEEDRERAARTQKIRQLIHRPDDDANRRYLQEIFRLPDHLKHM